jgi:hypothetical protein
MACPPSLSQYFAHARACSCCSGSWIADYDCCPLAEVTLEMARLEPRVKLVNRSFPNGVGLALRDGYAAAPGRYILSMDCDFLHIVPEFRDLFDAVARHKSLGLS